MLLIPELGRLRQGDCVNLRTALATQCTQDQVSLRTNKTLDNNNNCRERREREGREGRVINQPTKLRVRRLKGESLLHALHSAYHKTFPKTAEGSFCFPFEAGSRYVALFVLTLVILLPQPPQCVDYLQLLHSNCRSLGKSPGHLARQPPLLNCSENLQQTPVRPRLCFKTQHDGLLPLEVSRLNLLGDGCGPRMHRPTVTPFLQAAVHTYTMIFAPQSRQASVEGPTLDSCGV